VRTLLLAIILVALATPEFGQPASAPYRNPALSPEKRAADLVSRMTLEEKVLQMQNSAPAIPRLGVPVYNWWNEALHGVAQGRATVFPEPIGLGASFDPELVRKMADVISTEARAKFHEAMRQPPVTEVAPGAAPGRIAYLDYWSPNINIFRDPRWGRGQETYGEDPFLTSRMGVAFVKGMQGDDPRYLKTIATPKHFAVHSGPEPLRHSFDAKISEYDLVNTYLYAFKATVTEGKAGSRGGFVGGHSAESENERYANRETALILPIVPQGRPERMRVTWSPYDNDRDLRGFGRRICHCPARVIRLPRIMKGKG
jgi:beta-glucosidase